MKRALIGIGSFLLILILGVIAFLMLADFSGYKSDIEQAITEATGRETHIDGTFALEAIPPSIVAEGVTFGNADWGTEATALSVGHFSARIDGSSVFFGPLLIEEVRLRDVDVLIEKNAEGVSNWSLEMQDDEDDVVVDVQVEDHDQAGVVLQLAEITNIRVTQRAPGLDDRVIIIESIEASSSEDDYLLVTGSGALDDRPMNLEARIGPTRNFGDGENIDIGLEADLGILAATINGNTGRPATLEGTEFNVSVSSEDVTALIDLLDLPLVATGALRFDGQVDSSDGEPRLSFEGSVMDVEAGGSVVIAGDRMTVDLRASSLSGLGAIAGVTDLPAGPITAAGDVRVGDGAYGLIDFTVSVVDIEITSNVNAVIAGDRISLDPFSIVVGESDLSGELDISTSEPLQISGVVRSKLLDLTPFEGEEEAEAPPAPEPGEFVLSDEPLPFDFLSAGIVDLTVGIDTFRSGPLNLLNVEASTQLADGVLRQDTSFSFEAGGNATSAVTLAASGESAALEVDLDVSGVKFRLNPSGERSIDEIPPLGLTADINSSGNSMHSLAAASNGRLVLTQGPGIVNNNSLSVFSADILTELVTALNPFAKDEPYSVWDCTVVGVNIVDGVATVDPVLAQGQKITIVAEGTIDFNDESLDLSFNTKPRSGVGVSADMFLTPFIKLGGTLSSPRLELDKTGVLLEGGAAILTGGISFLVQGAADRATGAQDRCAAALAIANGEELEAETGRDQ